MVTIARNEVTEFHYATTLTTGTQYIVPVIGSATADITKKIRITDLVVSCGGSSRSIRLVGEGGSYKALQLLFPANYVASLNWELPYPLEAVSSTGAQLGIYASASGAGVQIAISGYIESFK